MRDSSGHTSSTQRGSRTRRANLERTFFQGSLFATADQTVDASFTTLERTQLDDSCWVDHAPRWLSGADDVFDELAAALTWQHKTVTMYERRLSEPRLTAWWSEAEGSPEPLPVLAEARRTLGGHYGVDFDSIGFNRYRDGNDSVAWHGDRRGPPMPTAVVAIVSVGAIRPFRLRPRGGGRSRSYELGSGDLLVMGGACQHRWEHCVPKVRHAGPRISITFRHSGVR